MIDYDILKYGIEVIIIFCILVEIVNYIISILCKNEKKRVILKIVFSSIICIITIFLTYDKYEELKKDYDEYLRSKEICAQLINEKNLQNKSDN